jgi:hypothetical protein
VSPEQAVALLAALGSDAGVQGEWVLSKCPLAPWTHKKGTDNNPSFGIRLPEGDNPHYNCFSCGGGSVPDLVNAMAMHTTSSTPKVYGLDLKTAFQILSEADCDAPVPLPEYSEFSNHHTQQFEEWPAHFIESFVRWNYAPVAVEYLKARGVTSAQAQRFNIRFDSKREMMVFPYTNVYGKLAGARGRSIHGGKGMGGHYDYTWNNRNNAQLTWYNENALNANEPIVIVEGQMDCIAVDKVYPHVMANLTAKPSPAKLQKLLQAPMVILFNDNDETGKIANTKYITQLIKHSVPYKVVHYPELLDSAGQPLKQDPDFMGSAWIEDTLKAMKVL